MRILLPIFLLVACSCKNKPPEYVIKVDNHEVTVSLKQDSVNQLQCFVGDSLTHTRPLPYPVYQFLKGDVDNDGVDDIAVGVIKATRFDPVVRKRLFVFRIKDNAIVPLWLGSGLGQPIEDFNIAAKDTVTVVRSIEKETNGKFLVAEYQWLGFGLDFNQYIERNIELNVAQEILHQ